MAGNHLTEKDMRAFIKSSLQAWHQPGMPVPHRHRLLIVAQAIPADANRHSELVIFTAIKQVLLGYLEIFKRENTIVANILTRHYIEKKAVNAVGATAQMSPDQVRHRLRTGYDALARIAYAHEIQLR